MKIAPRCRTRQSQCIGGLCHHFLISTFSQTTIRHRHSNKLSLRLPTTKMSLSLFPRLKAVIAATTFTLVPEASQIRHQPTHPTTSRSIARLAKESPASRTRMPAPSVSAGCAQPASKCSWLSKGRDESALVVRPSGADSSHSSSRFVEHSHPHSHSSLLLWPRPFQQQRPVLFQATMDITIIIIRRFNGMINVFPPLPTRRS
jgi:hypothetical protein